MPFYGNKWVLHLTWWIEKMESVFHLNFCVDDCMIKFATCTFMDAALTSGTTTPKL